MGIKDFINIKINNKTIRDYGYIKDINHIAGKKVVIDAFNMIYRCRYANENLSSGVKITSHIKFVLNQILMLKKIGVVQLWIFDGGFNPLKSETVSKRKVKITKDEIGDIKKLLNLLGMTYITVQTEAEFFAAALTKAGKYDYVLSTDMDVIVRGGNIFAPKKAGDYFVLHSSELPVGPAELAKMAVVLGCDFAPKTQRIGAGTVYSKLSSIKLTDRQTEAFIFLTGPLDTKIIEKPKTAANIPELKIWLRSLSFSNSTLDKL